MRAPDPFLESLPRLFRSNAEVDGPPAKPHDDLSAIRIMHRDSPEGRAYLAAREARIAAAKTRDGIGGDEAKAAALLGLS